MPRHSDPLRQDLFVQVYEPGPLPAWSAPRLPGVAEESGAPDCGDRKILIVESEPLLRIVLSDAFGFAGVDTIEAGHVQEALDILRERDDIGVLLADVSGTGLIDDLDFAWSVAVEHPDVQIVIMSALLEPNTVQIPRDAVFVRKPFTPDTIIRTVVPLLNESAEAALPSA
jgi:DNA-binding NtrC family response regulator